MSATNDRDPGGQPETFAHVRPSQTVDYTFTIMQASMVAFSTMADTKANIMITVCSIVHGANCHELQPIRLDENTMMIGCMLASQFEGAKWVETHPNYYLIRATCQPAGRFAKL